MQIFKRIIHNKAAATLWLLRLISFFYGGFIFITYKDKRVDKQGYFLPSTCHRYQDFQKRQGYCIQRFTS